jgi:hypothetical protein
LPPKRILASGTENPHHPIQKGKKKTLTIPTSQNPHPARHPPGPHSHLHSSATLHVTAYRRGNHLARCLSPTPAAGKPHRISPLPLAAAYRHRLSRRGSPSTQLRVIGESAVLELFLMENQVTNLLKYSIISYPSPSAPFNHPAEIAVDSFFF